MDHNESSSRSRPSTQVEQAKYHELEEEYDKALSIYENSSVELDHAIRLILKSYSTDQYSRIKQYLSKTHESRAVLAEFAILCGDFDTATHCYKLDGDKAALCRLTFMINGPQAAEQLIVQGSITETEAFNLNDENSAADIRQKLQSLEILESSLTSSTRKAILQLASLYLALRHFSKATSLYLCLAQRDLVLRLMDRQPRGRKLSLQLWSSAITRNRALYSLILSQTSIHRRNKLDEFSTDLTYYTDRRLHQCLKLGLLDEVLHTVCCQQSLNLPFLDQLIDTLVLFVRKRDPNQLVSIDSQLMRKTLTKIHASAVEDETLATRMITIIILSITVTLLKVTNSSMSEMSSARLEMTFEFLAELIRSSCFNTSDLLIQSTINLISSVKDKLEIIGDSDSIRESFGGLVTTIAHRGMVEGQYKNAAKLYSSIDDNVNAAKSLMRTGQVDKVISFALLVKDITVNRITINFLKHCDADSHIIENFIAKSRE